MRYLILFISFITSIILAARLGPYYYGVWGFVLLLLSYFQYFDFGISDSITVILVQNKNNISKTNDFEVNSLLLSSILGIFVVFIAIYYSIWDIPAFEKYNLGNIFYFVCVIAILAYFNKLFFKVYRVKGKIFEIGFYQSITTILVIIVVFLSNEKRLIYFLIFAYILGYLLSSIIFVRGRGISFSGEINVNFCKTIFNKGFLLFLYNFFFYLILLSTRTIISFYYTVEEFGFFTFSAVMANAILIILDAFAILVIPKVIDKFNSNNNAIIETTINSIKTNYVHLSFGMMCLLVFFYPFLLNFLPKYSSSLKVLNLLSLAVVFSTNSFGYSMYLRAINKEKTLAFISLISLIINISISLFLAIVLKVNYSYVVFSIMISYFIFTYLCVYYGKKELKQSVNFFHVLNESLPLRLLIPTLLIILITFLNNKILTFIPLLVFILLNIKQITMIYNTVIKVFENSEIFDIK